MNSEVNGIFVVAHDLKSPLTLMRQMALAMDFQKDSTAELEKSRNKIIRISERAMRQVNDLTKIARLEEGLFTLEPVSIRAVCDDVLSELEQLFALNQRKLRFEYRNKARLVIGNYDLIFSVIYNFCANAMYYSTVETESCLIISDKKDKIVVDVRDFGPSLPTTVWRQIKAGLAAPTSISMRPGSSGLGLYIASKFAKYLNAEVSAVRHRDGTSFQVILPVSHQAILPMFD